MLAPLHLLSAEHVRIGDRLKVARETVGIDSQLFREIC